LITNIVKYGIKSSTYSERANLITNYMDVKIQSLDYDVTLAVCDTAGHVLKKNFGGLPYSHRDQKMFKQQMYRIKKYPK